MEKSDKIAYGTMLIGGAIGYFIGGSFGWIMAALCVLLGGGLLYSAHSKPLDDKLEAEILSLPHFGSTSPRSTEPADNDPRITADYEKKFTTLTTTEDRFILKNRGGSDALEIQIADVRIGECLAKFPVVHILSSYDEKVLLADIWDTSGRHASPEVVHAFEMLLESHWTQEASKQLDGREFSRYPDCSISYTDFRGNKFKTFFTITYDRTEETAKIGKFVFEKL